MSSPYEPQKLKEEAAQKMLMIETAIEVKALINLFKAKGFVADCELDEFRKQLRKSPEYCFAYENAKKMIEAANLYETNPTAYLQMLFKAKMEGRV